MPNRHHGLSDTLFQIAQKHFPYDPKIGNGSVGAEGEISEFCRVLEEGYRENTHMVKCRLHAGHHANC